MTRLPELWFWEDDRPRHPGEDMAVDELLLRSCPAHAVLRCYRWSVEAASVGFAHDAGRARLEIGPNVPLVRRWTGGGLVRHGQDQTYTLVVPFSEESGAVHPDGGWRNSVEIYHRVHAALAAALRDAGLAADLAADGSQRLDTACFAAPVRHDVVGADGRKLAGAGHRRTRYGVLHQGSIACESGIGLEEARRLVRRMADHLADRVRAMPEELVPDRSAVRELAAARYPLLD